MRISDWSSDVCSSDLLSFVRTNAPPLPGLTCWNSMTFHSCPSMLRTTPFLMSAVEAMGRDAPFFWGLAGGTPTLHSRRRAVIARSSAGGSDATAARRGYHVGGTRTDAKRVEWGKGG